MSAQPALARARAQQWWQQRPARERWMLLGGIVVSVMVVIDLAWTAPLEKQARHLERELQARQDALQKSTEPLPSGQAHEAARLREQEAELRVRLQNAQQARQRLGQAAAQLPELLRTLTAQSGTLRLVALELSPDPATAPTTGSEAAARGGTGASVLAVAAAIAGQPAPAAASAAPTLQTTQDGQTLYRLPLMLKVSGPYADLQRLLGHIEAEAPSLQWTSLTLDGGTWPSVQMTLRAQAFSLKPHWGSPS